MKLAPGTSNVRETPVGTVTGYIPGKFETTPVTIDADHPLASQVVSEKPEPAAKKK